MARIRKEKNKGEKKRWNKAFKHFLNANHLYKVHFLGFGFLSKTRTLKRNILKQQGGGSEP